MLKEPFFQRSNPIEELFIKIMKIMSDDFQNILKGAKNGTKTVQRMIKGQNGLVWF